MWFAQLFSESISRFLKINIHSWNTYLAYNVRIRWRRILKFQNILISTAMLIPLKLIRIKINCPPFLELLPFQVTAVNSRYHVPFYLPFSNSFITLCLPLYRTCNSVNGIVTFSMGSLDIVFDSMYSILCVTWLWVLY